jgi:hypothetical protein
MTPIDLSDWRTWALGGATVGLLTALVVLRLRRPRPDALRDPGIALDQDIPLDLMNAPFAALSERRSSVRREGNLIAVLLSDARSRARPQQGWVLDRSTGGLRIASRTGLPEGAVLSVRTAEAPDTVPWLRIEVKSCVPVSDYYQLGCRFLETPPWNVLLLFG